MPTSNKMSRRQELYDLLPKIPEGTVVSYGAIGRALENPVSGLVAGKWMATCPPDLPWWRVIGADGTLKTFNRSPEIALEQRRLLEAENVTFNEEGQVLQSHFMPPEAIQN